MNRQLLIISVFAAALVLPVTVINMIGLSKYSRLKKQSASLKTYEKKFKKLASLEKVNAEVLSKHTSPPSNYIYKDLESLKLNSLREEQGLQFLETPLSSHPKIKEFSEILTQKVELDLLDLKTILFKIESIPFHSHVSKPHLIITDFALKKNKGLEDNRYRLNLEFIKRDYQE